jgi:hypothetical protein
MNAAGAACMVCLETLDAADSAYHRRCVRRLFRSPQAPRVELNLTTLHSVGLAMAGRMALSGVQRKISAGLSTDWMTLQLAIKGAHYILKPASPTFPYLPENEHLSMCLAPGRRYRDASLRPDLHAGRQPGLCCRPLRPPLGGWQASPRRLLPASGKAGQRQVHRLRRTVCPFDQSVLRPARGRPAQAYANARLCLVHRQW